MNSVLRTSIHYTTGAAWDERCQSASKPGAMAEFDRFFYGLYLPMVIPHAVPITFCRWRTIYRRLPTTRLAERHGRSLSMPFQPMFTLANPLFLIGLSAAAIPLLIHLSRSRRTKKIQFSTTRFFTDQFLRSYRMSRLKELLLLACRMALCALLAVALAGPMLLPGSGSPLAGQSRAIALVVDNSASMGLEEADESMLERARLAAKELLDGLRPGDTASLVLAGRRATGPEVLFAEPTPQLGDVRQALDGVRLSSLGTDLSTAVARARAIVARGAADSKEVYVLSDLQDSGWELPGDDAPPAAAAAESLVFFVRVRPEQPEDLAVTAVQYAASRPMVGVPFAIRPHVRNQSRHARSCVVKLWIDGELVGERTIEQLQAGRWDVPRFHHTFRKGGWHDGYVEIVDGSLPADDRRYFAFEVVDAVEVLAVNGAPSRIARLDELFFLKTALASAEGDKSPIHVEQAAPDVLATRDLAKYRAVVLANVESVPDAGVEKLESFVDRGGSLLMFLGDRTNQPFFNQTFAGEGRLHGGLAPGRLIGVEGKPSDAKASDGAETVASVGQMDLDHPVLAAFDDPRSANLAGVTFQALWTVEPGAVFPAAGGASAVLMWANTGSPLLVEKAFGKGRVMLFASSCDRDWTNFPIRPAYLPWVYRLVGYLAQEPLTRQGFYITGDAVPLAVSATEGVGQVLVRTPAGHVRPATPGDDPSAPLEFTETDELGVYQLFVPGKEAAGRRFVANLESYESDLTYLDEVFAQRGDDATEPAEKKIEAGFRELMGGSPALAVDGTGLVHYVAEPGRLHEASLTARRGLKLWDLVLWIALAVALVEPWLANRISLRHYGRPQEIVAPPPVGPMRSARDDKVRAPIS